MTPTSEPLKKPVWYESRIGLFLISVLLVLLLILISLYIFFSSNLFRVMLELKYGTIEGIREDDGYVFKGIPYAKPPIGNLRWKPTSSLTEDDYWTDYRKTDQFGSMCMQRNMLTYEAEGSEDCLYINVWTPTVNNRSNLPVMVYIHGGDLVALSGNVPGYSPTTKLAVETNMVHVSFNYRLNAFGYLALESFSRQSESGKSGNYGLWDQLEALRWIQQNIQQFGGNPGHVTVYGHSSGATSVFALLGTSLSNGLFHRAIMMGGSPILNRSLADASKDNLKLVKNANCPLSDLDQQFQCLMNMSPEEVLNAIPWDEYPAWSAEIMMDLPVKGMFVGALLIVDGDILSTSPTKFWESDNFIDVPLMIGSMAQEIDIYPTVGDQIKDWTWHDYEIYVRSKFDSFDDTMSDRILELYPPSQRYSTPELSFTTMASDIRVTCGNDEITDIASRKFQSPVYRFVGTARPSKPVHWFGFGAEYAFHGWDMMGFFDSMNQYIAPNSDDRLFRDRMQVYLTSFAQTGNPDDNWLKWTGLGSTALLSHDIKYTHRFNKTRCDFMKDNGFLSYSWIN